MQFVQADMAMTPRQELAFKQAKTALHESENRALELLAEADLGPFYGAKLLRAEQGIPVGEAKKRVHASGVWRHLDQQIEELHSELESIALSEVD